MEHKDDLNLPEDRPTDRVFYCRACGRSYSLAAWTITSLPDDDDPIGNWYDCATIRCAAGHGRHADLAIFTYRRSTKPRRPARRHPLLGWLARVTEMLERRAER